MSQYELLRDQVSPSLVQVSPGLIVLVLFATGWFNHRTARRFRAALIDLVIATLCVIIGGGVIGFVPSSFSGMLSGGILGSLYLVFRDGWPVGNGEGRSIGKRIMRLRVRTESSAPSSLKTTLLRNFMFICVVLICFEQLWAAVVINAVVIVEALLVCLTPQMMRVGDHIAGTRITRRVREKCRSDDALNHDDPARAVGWGELD